MIQKKKWIDIKNKIIGVNSTDLLQISALTEEIKILIGHTSSSYITSAFNDMVSYFYFKRQANEYVRTDSCPWDDLVIFVSSFKDLGSHSYISKLFFDLRRYLEAYKMLLTNDGFAKKVIYQRFFHSQDEADGNNKNYFSETPQVSSGDEALDNLEYLSNASKDFSHGETSLDSEDNSTQTSTTWDEARKNYEMIYFKDIYRFIIKIPYLVYDFYALDDYPVTYSLKEFYEAVKRSFDF